MGENVGKKLNIRGQRFGNLVAIEPTEKRDDSGSIVWKMRCDCGNEHFISVRNIKYRGTKSCGACPTIKYEIHENVTFGLLNDGTKFIIDTDDYLTVSNHSWCRSGNGYMHSRINGKYICLHRLIMKVDKPKVIIDHINRDKDDNRKENLRITNGTGNGLNKYINKSGRTSKYRGVCWDKSRNKWQSEISVGHKICLGRFNLEKEAASAYNYSAYLLAPQYIDFNDVPEAPKHIKDFVYNKCSAFLTKNGIAV